MEGRKVNYNPGIIIVLITIIAGIAGYTISPENKHWLMTIIFFLTMPILAVIGYYFYRNIIIYNCCPNGDVYVAVLILALTATAHALFTLLCCALFNDDWAIRTYYTVLLW